jgi:hypothetical protein
MVIISPFTFVLMVALVAISVSLVLRYFFPEKDNYNYHLPGVVFDRLPVFHPKPGDVITHTSRSLKDLEPPIVEKTDTDIYDTALALCDISPAFRKEQETRLMADMLSSERRNNVVRPYMEMSQRPKKEEKGGTIVEFFKKWSEMVRENNVVFLTGAKTPREPYVGLSGANRDNVVSIRRTKKRRPNSEFVLRKHFNYIHYETEDESPPKT